MSEKLGVDIKKLRDFENGRKLPDSELLSRLYWIFNISPAAILKDKKGLESEISIYLDQLNTENKMQVFEIITLLHSMSC